MARIFFMCCFWLKTVEKSIKLIKENAYCNYLHWIWSQIIRLNLIKFLARNPTARDFFAVQKFFLKNIFSIFIFKNIFANEEYFYCLKREYGISFQMLMSSIEFFDQKISKRSSINILHYIFPKILHFLEEDFAHVLYAINQLIF